MIIAGLARTAIPWAPNLACLAALFTVGGLTRGNAPLLIDGGASKVEYADPLPQALILTAIVIGFGVQAFALVLFKRVYQTIGSDDLDKLTATDVGS